MSKGRGLFKAKGQGSKRQQSGSVVGYVELGMTVVSGGKEGGDVTEKSTE